MAPPPSPPKMAGGRSAAGAVTWRSARGGPLPASAPRGWPRRRGPQRRVAPRHRQAVLPSALPGAARRALRGLEPAPSSWAHRSLEHTARERTGMKLTHTHKIAFKFKTSLLQVEVKLDSSCVLTSVIATPWASDKSRAEPAAAWRHCW